MNNFLRLIRFPNLVIIALTQCLLQFMVIEPALMGVLIDNISTIRFTFIIIVIYTVLIAAAGNVINDIEDVQIDKINKPLEKRLVGRVYTEGVAWQIYIALNAMAFIMALLPMFYEKNYTLLYIFPIVVSLLFFYSKKLKKVALKGNIIIACLCSFSAFIVLWGNEQLLNIYEDNDIENNVELIVEVYIFFAFISTLFREIIKDIEDIEGDKANKCETLPVLIGIKWSKWVAFVVGLILLISVLFFSQILRGSPENIGRGGIVKIIFLNICISLPIIYALYKLIMAEEKKDFTYLSKLSKWIMLGGIVFILIMKLG